MVKGIILGTSFLIMGLATAVYKTKNPGFNPARTLTIHQAIFDHNPIHITLVGGDTTLDVHYVARSARKTVNPNFPSIHLATSTPHNAWLHIVRNDAGGANTFIDASEALYPAYTYDQDFYDAPCWNSSLWSKPLRYWHGHAYPVEIDNENKTIRFVDGGVHWGFQMPFFTFGPRAIVPRIVSDEEKRDDIEYLQTQLSSFSQIS